MNKPHVDFSSRGELLLSDGRNSVTLSLTPEEAKKLATSLYAAACVQEQLND